MQFSAPTADAPTAGPTARPDPHAQLRDILRGPLYQRWTLRERRQQRSASWADYLFAWIGEKLDGFIEWLRELLLRSDAESSAPGGGPGLTVGFLKTIGWVVLPLLVLVLIYFVLRALADRRNTAPRAHVLSRDRVRDAMRAGEALALDADQWLAEAERRAARFDFRGVYRALYLGLLSGLHQRRAIDFHRNRTNWVYVSHFRGADDQRRLFQSLTALFDDVWYGRKRPRGANLDRIRRQIEHLLGAPRNVE